MRNRMIITAKKAKKNCNQNCAKVKHEGILGLEMKPKMHMQNFWPFFAAVNITALHKQLGHALKASLLKQQLSIDGHF